MYNLHRCTSSSIQYDRMYSYSTSTSSRSFACLTLSLAQTIISRQLSRCVRFIRFSIRNSRCFAMGALALSDSSGKELIGGTEPEQKALDNVRAEYDEKMRLEREERERRRAEAEQAAQLRREQEALRVKETPEQRVERVLAERDAKEKMLVSSSSGISRPSISAWKTGRCLQLLLSAGGKWKLLPWHVRSHHVARCTTTRSSL